MWSAPYCMFLRCIMAENFKKESRYPCKLTCGSLLFSPSCLSEIGGLILPAEAGGEQPLKTDIVWDWRDPVDCSFRFFFRSLQKNPKVLSKCYYLNVLRTSFGVLICEENKILTSIYLEASSSFSWVQLELQIHPSGKGMVPDFAEKSRQALDVLSWCAIHSILWHPNTG